MSFDVGAAVATIKADLTDFKKGISDAKNETNSLGDTMGKVGAGIADFGKQAAIFTGIAAGGLALFAKSSVDAYNEQEKAIAQTEAVLQSTAKARVGVYEQVAVGTKTVTNTTEKYSDSLKHAEAKLTDMTNRMKDAKNPTEMQKLALEDQQKVVDKLHGSATNVVTLYETRYNPAMVITAKYVADLSAQMQKQTTYGDEVVQTGVNMLLTFTNVGKKVLPDATTALLDMSTAMGQDVTQTAIQLGKALNDPILGATALRRVGVMLTDQQQEQIKTLIGQNKLYDAQQIILKELSTEFGGSAAAAAKTFEGKMKQLKNTIGDVQEVIGGAIASALIPLADALKNIVESNTFQIMITLFQNLMALFAGADTTPELFEGLSALVGSGAAAQIVTFLAMLQEKMFELGAWISEHQALVITFLQGLAVAVGALLVIGTVTALIMAFTNPLVLAALAIAALYTAYQTNFLGIRDITNAVVTEVINFFQNYLMPAIQVLVAYWQTIWPYVSQILKGNWDIMIGIIQIAWAIVYGILKVGLALLSGDWGKAWDAIKQMVETVWAGLKNIFKGMIEYLSGWGGWLFDSLTKPFRDAWDTISALVNKIKDALDFTKRHSPSVVDIVEKGVRLVNRAFEDLPIDMPNLTPAGGMGAAIGAGGNGGISNITLQISMDGAIISDDFGAQRMAEKVGDSIVKKLQQNIRF